MNGYLNKLLSTQEEDYVIASDTDSIYLNLGPLVTRFLGNQSGDKVKVVELPTTFNKTSWNSSSKSLVGLGDALSTYEQKMVMKRENIADRGIWTAKKHTFSTCGTGRCAVCRT